MKANLDQTLREVVVRMSGTLELDVALRRLVDCLAELMPVDVAALSMFEPEFGALRILTLASRREGRRLGTRVGLSPALRKVVEDAWRSGLTPSEQDTMRIADELAKPLASGVLRTMDLPEFTIGDRLVRMLELAGQRVATLVLLGHKGGPAFQEADEQILDEVKVAVALAVSNALKHQELLNLKERLQDENRFLRRELMPPVVSDLVGAEFGLRGVMDMVRRISALEVPVLVLGETGVGKEVIAALIHQSSPRRDGPFIRVNCGAIPESLVESELFGHEKGAFTGAFSRQIGRFERAQGGTVFLDEVGELPAEAQVKLLRVLQARELERVGGSETVPLDIRIIAATNRDLRAMALEGRFRDDLLYRLDVFPIDIPPLRDRREDIPELVAHFIKKKLRALGLAHPPLLAPGAIDQLLAYHWPGNVRELENVVERTMILAGGRQLTFHGLRTPDSPSSAAPLPSSDASTRLDDVVRDHIVRILELCGGKVSGPGGAAESLGIHPNTLRNRMDRLGIAFRTRRLERLTE